MQPAKMTGKRLVGVAVEVLIAEHQHHPVGPGLTNVLELMRLQRRREVEAFDLSADMRRDGFDAERRIPGAPLVPYGHMLGKPCDGHGVPPGGPWNLVWPRRPHHRPSVRCC